MTKCVLCSFDLLQGGRERRRKRKEEEEEEEMKLYATQSHSELVAPVVIATIRIEDEANLVTLELSRL